MADVLTDRYPGKPGGSGEWERLRQRILEVVSRGDPASVTETARDPLIRPPREWARSVGSIAFLLIGAIAQRIDL